MPIYHAALARTLEKPLMVVIIGGVGQRHLGGRAVDRRPRATWSPSIAAPGNALIDDWLGLHTKARFDEEGRVAAGGKVDVRRVSAFLNDPFFSAPAPKIARPPTISAWSWWPACRWRTARRRSPR
ncbi:MAG: anhydro-N-acetylmuramic acid kinase [Alphaproteobacteria bacterium]